MDQTFHTLIHVAPKVDVDELAEVRRQLGKLLGKEFVKQSDIDPSCINKMVRISLSNDEGVDCIEYRHYCP